MVSLMRDCKRFKMMQNNVVMVGLTVSVHFQQIEDLLKLLSKLETLYLLSQQILPKSWNLAQHSNGSQSLSFCVCQSHICFSIKSLNFSVLVSDFKMPVSASQRVLDLPFATSTYVAYQQNINFLVPVLEVCTPPMKSLGYGPAFQPCLSASIFSLNCK